MLDDQKTRYAVGKPELDQKIEELIKLAGIKSETNRFREMMVTVLKFASDNPTSADILQFNRTMKEIRYANKVFRPYAGIRRISIFGSARIQPHEIAYQAAEEFARMMREAGYMIITGGGGGIMAAAQAGAGREKSFALNIALPFEQSANATIAGDRKLISFKYFFTRKLNFIKHSSAVVSFPGGVGTMDETFEALTLMQTGKAAIVPVILMDAPAAKINFWAPFNEFLKDHMLAKGLVSSDDFYLFKTTSNLEEARTDILKFYHNFHSYRFIKDVCVIRIHREIPPSALKEINEEFTSVVEQGSLIEARSAFDEEASEGEISHLPRLAFVLAKRKFGLLRKLIDRINEF